MSSQGPEPFHTTFLMKMSGDRPDCIRYLRLLRTVAQGFEGVHSFSGGLILVQSTNVLEGWRS